MMFITLLQLPIPKVPFVDGDVANQILGWIIGILIAFVGALYLYFRNEIHVLRTELKEERAYNRVQDGNNIKMITETNMFLSTFTGQLNKSSGEITEINRGVNEVVPIVKANETRLISIKDHVSTRNG